MGFFRAFPTFLTDGWVYPGSREHCCMRCFSTISVSVFLSYRTCPCLHQLFLSAPSVLYFTQFNIYALHPPALQVIPLPSWLSWVDWWRVSEMSQHAVLLWVDYLKPWALWCLLSKYSCVICCRGDTTQAAFTIGEIFIFMAASCYFRV